MTPKKKKQKRGFCIFCRSSDNISKEHIWPAWLEQYVPHTGDFNYHVTRMNQDPIQVGRLNRAADPFSMKMRIVCRKCNNGWMSILQSKAKPILYPLIQDRWSIIGEEDIKTLALWATMFTMVVEFAHPETAAVPAEHRVRLMETQTIPTTWRIWIGRHAVDASQHPAMFNHFGGTFTPIKPPGPVISYQTTGFTVGNLLFQTVTAEPEFPLFAKLAGSFANKHDMIQIFPFNVPIWKIPDTIHNRESSIAASSYFQTAMGHPTMSDAEATIRSIKQS